MVGKIEGSQTDFSFGEVDPALKRNDQHPARKAGLRQMANARILNSGSVQNRPGRRALQVATNRVDEITIAPGVVFRFNFTPATGGTLNIFDANGAPVLAQTGLGYTALNIPFLTVAVLLSAVYIAGPGLAITYTTWTSPSTWQPLAQFLGTNSIGGQARRFFYRITPKGVSMHPSGLTGNITVQFSSNILQAGHVSTLMRYINREILITGINSPSNCNATVLEPLPASQTVNVATDPTGIFNLGDEVIGSVSNAKGLIVTLTAVTVGVQLLSSVVTTGLASGGAAPGQALTNFLQIAPPSPSVTGFVATDVLAGPGGSIAISSITGTGLGGPNSMTFWDEEVMNTLRGWPSCVFSDQNRLGFSNFPSVPNGIGWSAINQPDDHYVGPNPGDAMFELVPNKVQVFYVVPGPEGSEFVFTDRGVFYIPISETNPLRSGSVAFKLLSGDGVAQVQPRRAQEAILYVNAGLSSVMAIIATGAYQRPFSTKNLTEFHAHLFSGIVAIAAPSADGTFNERYAYVLNGNGSVVVGKYSPDSLLGNAPVIGWGPWSSAGTTSWVAARGSNVQFITVYPGVTLLEQIDDVYYLDAGMLVNAAPTALAPPGAGLTGPLWFWASRSVSLMDQGTRMMGTYQVDSHGNIVPQGQGGENLNAATLVAGQPWTMTVEPFCPAAAPGTDVGQRMKKRRVALFAAYVENSTGFLMARLFSGPITPTSPPLGTVVNQRRVTAWNIGDDATHPPPQREEVQRWRPLGRAFDPRVAIIKDTPGPLLIPEIAIEATI